MSGARHRRKGDRCEREIVALHLDIGIHAERVPLSGATLYAGRQGSDVDIYIGGKDSAPIVSEVKARKSGSGFILIESWLGDIRGGAKPRAACRFFFRTTNEFTSFAAINAARRQRRARNSPKPGDVYHE